MKFELAIASALVGLTAIGCGGAEEDISQDESALHGNRDLRKIRRAFRRATAKYHNTNKLAPDGWVQLQEECFTEEFTEGGGGTINLGIVFVNPARIDAVIDEDQPEILYYEPQANGHLRLMGGEYFCDIADCPTPPVLRNQVFRFEEDTNGHALHVWAWLRNPNGLTFPVNPRVDTTYCPEGDGDGDGDEH